VERRGLPSSLLAALTSLLVLSACVTQSMAPSEPGASASASVSPSVVSASPSPIESMPPTPPTVTLLAVGDIGSCDGLADESVAALAVDLIGATQGVVALLGDTVYPKGTTAEFDACFDPAWQPIFSRLRPVPGNHEYETPAATGYFDEFANLLPGDRGAGWYAYQHGDWLILALNSNCEAIGGCGPDSPQYRWLAERLAADNSNCVLAYWHHPRYSSGRHGSDDLTEPLWSLLADAGADLVLSGHDHTYERFAPIDGIRQFVVGTGGRSLYPFEGEPLPQTEARADDTYGLLQLSLEPGGYAWRFVPATDVGGSFTDVGDAACH